MLELDLSRKKVDQFILREIDSIPHLEALLLLWNSKPKQWLLNEMVRELYLPIDRVTTILHDLENHGLIVAEYNRYFYNSGYRQDMLIDEVDKIYRQELIRISDLIHSKTSPAEEKFAS